MAMARAVCTCTECGEEFGRIKECPSRKSADEWEAWAAGHFRQCDDCRKKAQAKRHAEENRQAAENAASQGLPPLVGTPKQVAWANVLRQDVLAYMDGCKLNENGRRFRQHLVETKTSAADWINSRGDAQGFLDLEFEVWKEDK